MNLILKNKKYNFLKYLILILSSISLFCFSYNFFKENSSSITNFSLNNYLKKIYSINLQCTSFSSENEINITKALKRIPKIKEELENLNHSLSITKDTQNDENYPILKRAIDNNVLIYTQMESMLKNPSANDIETSAKNLRQYYNNALENYLLLKNDNGFLKPLFYSIELTNNFCFASMNSAKQQTLKDDQLSLFMGTLVSIEESFIPLKTDMSNILSDARSNSITYELAISKVNDKISEVTELSNQLIGIPVPNRGLDCYENLKSSLSEYLNYLENFKYGLSMEKVYVSSDNKISKNSFDSLYENCKTHLDLTEKYFNSFKENYSLFKSIALSS